MVVNLPLSERTFAQQLLDNGKIENMYRNLLKYLVVCCVGVVAFAICAGTAQANLLNYAHLQPNDPNDSVVLSDLLNGEFPGIVVGDKKFTNFTYMTTGDMPDGSMVNVTGLFVGGNYGVRFQGGFKDLFDNSNESSDALIEFTVSVVDPSRYLISDVHLSGDPSLSASGSLNAFAEVVESFPGDFDNLQLRIQNDLNGLIGAAEIDPLPIPVESLRVSKDIQLLSIERVRASISRIDQTFSQIEVPEPTTTLLFVVAVMASATVRRRRSQVRR